MSEYVNKLEDHKGDMDEHDLEKLQVWQMARELVTYVYREIVPKLPSAEKYGLTSQLRRAVVSIPANIAEGHGRYYFKENIRFCNNARGSLDELFSHIVVANDLGFIPSDVISPAKERISNLRQALNGYIRYLRGKIDSWDAQNDDTKLGETNQEYSLRDSRDNPMATNDEEERQQ
jgi:four helix bundle protein